MRLDNAFSQNLPVNEIHQFFLGDDALYRVFQVDLKQKSFSQNLTI